MGSSDSGSRPSVEAKGLTKCFPARRSLLGRPRGAEQTAVDGVDLALAEGEVFGLVGPNGAGKTTLIKLLTTLLRPTSGTARIGDLDVVADEYRVRGAVGLVTSNERSFYWRLTGRQNLEFFASLYELPAQEATPWIDELFQLLDLEDKADARFDSYSTGMKQRLAFARGLLQKPRFLFMDEPTKGVDPVSRAELVSILEERILARWHPTVLVTSHDLAEIELLCDRIAFMDAGRIVAQGSLGELQRLGTDRELFELHVAHLPHDRLLELARAAGAAPDPAIANGSNASHNGTAQLDVGFPRGTDGFPRLVRSIVESGGELVSCTSHRESLENIFKRLVPRSRAAKSEESP